MGIVPHTHWDREWYAPFQRYRVQLVHLVDDLLDLLEADPSFTRFLLDGQTAVIDDYLAVRPEAEPRLRALAGAGRLQVGPWMILMDEFMVSGETIVRNLQHGVARAAEFGGNAAPVGYLPDMFGHIAQMPQLLRLAGLEHAVVWRGVPSEIDQTAFWWRAPDGSTVRAEYLYGSYSNGRDIPKDPTQLVARARGYDAELGAAALPGGGMLLMNGSDHLLPQPWLGDVVAAANELQDDYRFAVTSLAEYVREQPTEGLARWDGELRSGARANVLMGVASNRVDVHQLAAHAERSLERYAEPLSALLLPATDYPAALLDVGWRQLVLNSAHDSSCACSADEVVDQVLVRYAEARQIGDGLTRDAVRTLATTVDVPASSTIVVNPHCAAAVRLVERPAARCSGPVHLVALDDGTACPTQVVGDHDGGEGISTVVVGQKVRWVLEMMRGPELAGARIHASSTRRLPDGGRTSSPFTTRRPARPRSTSSPPRSSSSRWVRRVPRSRSASAALRCATCWSPPARCRASGGGRTARSRAKAPPPRCAPTGWSSRTSTCARWSTPPTARSRSRPTASGSRAPTATSTAAMVATPTTTRRPPSTSIVDRPTSVAVTVIESGPVRARIGVDRDYSVPARAIGDEHSCTERSDETRAHRRCVTTYELRTGERFVRVHVALDHRVRDHRLRAHFPLAVPVEGSDAECAFAVVRRGLTAEGGPHEVGLPTFVSRRFVDCSAADDGGGVGLALVHDGLLEYEVVEGGSELALTLVRATGYLSRSEPLLRPNPAGPLDRLEGPQLQTALALDYAVLPHRGDWRAADAARDRRRRARAVGVARRCAVAAGRAHRLPATGRARRRRRRGVGSPARRTRCTRAAGGEPHARRRHRLRRPRRHEGHRVRRRPHRRRARTLRRSGRATTVGAPHAPARRRLNRGVSGAGRTPPTVLRRAPRSTTRRGRVPAR